MSKQDILTVSIVSICVIAIILLVIRLTKAAKDDASKTQNTQQVETEPEPPITDADTSFMQDDSSMQMMNEPAETAHDFDEHSTASKHSTPSSSENTTTESSSTGRYMVLAGSYTKRANADKMVSKLKKKGYSNAGVEIFDRGKFAVILVDRFDDLESARSLQQRLKADGFDCYVKLKQAAN